MIGITKFNCAIGGVKKHTKITGHNRRFERPRTQTPDLAWRFAGGEYRCSYLSIESQICNSPGNQSAKISAAHSAKLFAQSSAKISADQSGQYFAGFKYETLSYPNPDIPNRGEITLFAKGDFSHLSNVGNSRHLSRIEYLLGGTARCIVEFSQSIKKGSTANATSLNCIFLRYLINQSGHHSVNRHRRKVQLSDDLVLRLSDLSFFSQASITHDEKFELSRSTLESISSSNSCGKRMFFNCDFLFMFPVDMSLCSVYLDCVYTLYNKKLKIKSLDLYTHYNLMCLHTLFCLGAKYSNAPKCANTIEAFNHNVNRGNSMAMYKSTQTHPKFTWRFAECQENKATYHTATAYTEDEARSQLPDLPLVFTARIRREVSYA